MFYHVTINPVNSAAGNMITFQEKRQSWWTAGRKMPLPGHTYTCMHSQMDREVKVKNIMLPAGHRMGSGSIRTMLLLLEIISFWQKWNLSRDVRKIWCKKSVLTRAVSTALLPLSNDAVDWDNSSVTCLTDSAIHSAVICAWLVVSYK